MRENASSAVWPNATLPFPPKENLFTSFAEETKENQKIKLENNGGHVYFITSTVSQQTAPLFFFFFYLVRSQLPE